MTLFCAPRYKDVLGNEVITPSILNLGTSGGDWSDSSFGRSTLTIKESAPVHTGQEAGWAPRVGLDEMAYSEIPVSAWNRTLVAQPRANYIPLSLCFQTLEIYSRLSVI